MIDYILSDHAKKRFNQRGIKELWIQDAINSPDKIEIDAEYPEKTYVWKIIAEMDNRVLKVAYNNGHNPIKVITVHFDRNMRNKL